MLRQTHFASRKEYSAALCIVLQCRVFLGRCLARRLRTNLEKIYSLHLHHSCHNTKISIENENIFELLVRQGTRNSNQLKVNVGEHISNYTSTKKELVNSPERVRLDEKIASMFQISNATNDQLKFIGTLRAHSKSQSERTKLHLKTLLEKCENIRTVQEFIIQGVVEASIEQKYGDGFLQWIHKEKKAIEIIMLECDSEHHRALEDEQNRKDIEIQNLLDSERLFTSKIDTIKNIEGLEAEMYSFHIQAERRGAERSKTDCLLAWIDRNGAMTEEAENHLENIYADISLFYHQKTFDQNLVSGEVRACCKTSIVRVIRPFYSHEWFGSFEKKPWIQLHQQQIAIQQYRRIQEHIRIRRDDLLANQVVEIQEDDLDRKANNHPSSGRLVPEMKVIMQKHFSVVKAVRQGVVHMRIGITTTKDASILLLKDFFAFKRRASAHNSNPPLPLDAKANPLEYITKILLIEDRHVNQMRKVFRRIDKDMDGLVSTEDLVKAMNGLVTTTSLISKLLGIILDEKNQPIVCLNFGGFARGLCSLAVLGKDEMIKLIFNLIDEGGFGFIQEHRYREVTHMLDPQKHGFAFRALRDDILPESISFAQFEALNGKYPNALHPLFTFQHSVRESLVGSKYWVRKMRKFKVAKESNIDKRH